MTDQFDRAQALELADWEARQRRPVQPDPAQWTALSAELCRRCGATIPEARRRHVVGVQLCVPCQTDAERIANQKGVRHGR